MRRVSVTAIKKQPPEVFYKRAAVKNFAVTRKHLCLESLVSKLADLQTFRPNVADLHAQIPFLVPNQIFWT